MSTKKKTTKKSVKKGKSVKITRSCYQCKATSVSTGKRCKNMIACEKGCHAYCHVHSGGYKDGSNAKCKSNK